VLYIVKSVDVIVRRHWVYQSSTIGLERVNSPVAKAVTHMCPYRATSSKALQPSSPNPDKYHVDDRAVAYTIAFSTPTPGRRFILPDHVQ